MRKADTFFAERFFYTEMSFVRSHDDNVEIHIGFQNKKPIFRYQEKASHAWNLKQAQMKPQILGCGAELVMESGSVV